MTIKTSAAAFLGSFMLLATAVTPATAQDKDTTTRIDKEITVYDFPEYLIPGERDAPMGDKVTGRLPGTLPSLIKTRRHFIPELIVSAYEL